MSGSKAKGKTRAGSSSNARSTQKRSSFASAGSRTSLVSSQSGVGTVPNISSDNSGSDSVDSNDTSSALIDMEDSPAIRSLLPDKSDSELTYEDMIKSLNASIVNSSTDNSNLSITDAIPAMRELVYLRHDLKRLLTVSTTQLTECDKNLSKLKRLSTALDRESTKRMKVINAAAAAAAAASSSDTKSKSDSNSDNSDSKEATPVEPEPELTLKNKPEDSIGESSTKEYTGESTNSEIVTIKTELNDSNTSALPTDTVGLADTHYKAPPEYEKNPKSEFVESQSLPTAALNLFEDQVKGLPVNGKEYLLKKYAVASYPPDDLKDWLPGEIPDHDFTKAKPPNQVQFSTFSSYIEPYFRPLTEEDLHFLEQKLAGGPYDHSYMPTITGTGAAAAAAAAAAASKRSQLSPYIIPKLGRLYSDVWKEQDGPTPGYSLNPPEPPTSREVDPHGSSDKINDDDLEKDDISCGPLASRLLAAILSEETVEESTNAQSSDGDAKIKTEQNDNDTKTNDNDNSNDTSRNGSIIKQEQKLDNNGSSTNNLKDEFDNEEDNEKDDAQGRSATLANTDWKIGVKNRDFLTLEERLKQELKYVGIIDMDMLRKEEERKQRFEELAGPPAVPVPPTTNSKLSISSSALINGDISGDSEKPEAKHIKHNEMFDIDWVNGREDDEISTELRFLQKQLMRVSRLNMAYQRVLHPIVQQQLAWQEYSHILEDLDKQVDQAYMRRNRANTRIKKKKSSSSHGGGASSSGRNGTSVTPAPGAAAANAAEQGHRMKSLLDKRMKWVNMIGPVFESPRLMKRMPRESIFSHIDVEELMRAGGDGTGMDVSGSSNVGGGAEDEVGDAMMDAFDKTRGGTPGPGGKVDDLYGIVPT